MDNKSNQQETQMSTDKQPCSYLDSFFGKRMSKKFQFGNSRKQTTDQNLVQWREQLLHHCNTQIDSLHELNDEYKELDEEISFYQQVIKKGKHVIKILTWREIMGVLMLCLIFGAIYINNNSDNSKEMVLNVARQVKNKMCQCLRFGALKTTMRNLFQQLMSKDRPETPGIRLLKEAPKLYLILLAALSLLLVWQFSEYLEEKYYQGQEENEPQRKVRRSSRLSSKKESHKK